MNLGTDPGRPAASERQNPAAAARRAGAVLAIDGGNSKTDAILVDENGAVIATGRAGGFTPQITGVDSAIETAAQAVAQIRAQLVERGGIPAPGDGEVALARHLAAYVAGADLEVEEQILAAAFAAQGWADTLEVGNDTFALLRSGSTGRWGVAVVCGDGINCAGIGPDGRRARFPALGPITGDWGGGSHLGEKTLGQAVRGEDGRGRPTALSAAVAAHFGRGTAEEVAIAMHLGEINMGRVRELSPILMRVAETGDETAAAIADRMAAEVVTLARVALARLGLARSAAEVVLGGGVLRAQPPALMRRIRDLASEQIPQASLVIAHDAPVHGAALLGLDTLGLTPPAALNHDSGTPIRWVR